MTLTEIINELASTSSKNEKEAIMIKNKDNKDLKRIFEVTYSKDLNFFVRQFKVDLINTEGLMDINESIEMLVNEVASRNYTGNDARSYMTQLVQTCKEPELLLKVINRDLECGIQQTITNKVWKDIITDPPYMSYKLFKPELIKKLKFPAYSDVKQDGLYADVIVHKDLIIYRSRSGKELNFRLPESEERKLKELAEYPGESFVLHSEALVIDPSYPNGVQPREIGNGYLNQDPELIDSDKVKLVTWDMVTYKEYLARKSEDTYDIRREELRCLTQHLKSNHVEMIEGVVVNSISEIIDHFIACRKKGLEGTVVKSFTLLWEDKKVSQGIKIKNEFDAEFIVTGYIEHKKKPGWIGSLLVESSDGKIKFGVGSGLTDKLRKEPFENFKLKILTVKGNDIGCSESKDTWSVFLPRYVELRNDKTKANTFEECMEAKDSIIAVLKEIAEDLENKEQNEHY